MSVFHLKYRPQSLAELDLADVGEKLNKILKTDNLPQSFLFAGPKGSGKTSAARIVAKVINCEKPKSGDACNKCENCLSIQKGNSIDIIEIDAASNRGIEEARDLKEKAYRLPAKLSRKVFIIDEVHMMTKEAFNALLKLIEEPPLQTFFILCTTDAGKIPETILSRLVRIDFRKGKTKELLNSLNRIIESEKIEISEASLDKIIEKSDGSFRNIQRTLNELVMEYGKKIKDKEVSEFFNIKFGEYTPLEMENDLVDGEAAVILEKIEKMAENGVDFRSFRENLIIFFQDRMLGTCGVGDREKSKLPLERLEKWLQLLIAAGKQEKDVTIDQLPIELAVVNFLGDSKRVNSDKLTVISEEKTVIVKPEEKIPIQSKKIISNVDVGFGVEKVESEWGKILVAVKPYNHSVEAFLRAARPHSMQGNLLTLEVFYPFHKDKLEEQKNRKIVETGLSEVLGKDLIFECILGNSKKASLVIKNDTPESLVSDNLVENKAKSNEGDIYDVAKEIFG